jgi:hypothetical protein
MKRLFILFFLVISLSALYMYFASCKEGARSGWTIKDIKKTAINANKKRIINNKIEKRRNAHNK